MSSSAPLSRDEVINTVVDVICDGLVNRNATPLMTRMQKRLVTLDGNIAAGKTTLLAKVGEKTGAKVMFEQAPKAIMELFYKAMEEKKRTGLPNEYAAQAQMYFSMQRAITNCNGNAIAGRTNDYGFPEFPWGEQARDVYTDRSRIGDMIFLVLNWLSGDISDASFNGIISANKTVPTFRFDVAVYIDARASVSKARSDGRAAANPERAHEVNIPLEYFEGIRKLHYIVLRQCALRGAPIVCLSNEEFLTVEQVVEATTRVPDQKHITRLWEFAPVITLDSAATEVDEAFSAVLKAYAELEKPEPVAAPNEPIPYVEVIIAGMRGGKTTELIRRYGQRRATPAKVKLVKPKKETRWVDPDAKGPPQVATHSGFRKECVTVASLEELKLDPATDEWVFIDEVQFFGNELMPFLMKHHWAKFVLAGLVAYSDLKPFGQLRDVICIASEVTHFKAVCQFCHQYNAAFSPALRRKTRPDEVGSIQYGSACSGCWAVHNVN